LPKKFRFFLRNSGKSSTFVPDFKNDLNFVQTKDKNMYTRHLQSTLLQLSKSWPVITVTGPRQSGKTTLCKMAFPNYGYVNLEHIPTRDHINDFSTFSPTFI
jgi:hypothetical protein